MKRIGLVLLLFTCLNVYSQNRFRAGLKAGLVTSQVEGDTYAGFNKLGFTGGAFVTAKLKERWSVQFEMLFIQKGSRHTGDLNLGDYSSYSMKLNYLEVPVLVKFHQKKITYEAGPTFGYLISAKENNYYGPTFSGIPFKATEIGFALGINYAFTDHWGVNCRYSNSLTAIRTFSSRSSVWYGQRNNVIALAVACTFGKGK